MLKRSLQGTNGCDEAAWPDKDHDLVCGECKVLVNRFNSFYGSCDGYCSSIGRVCTGAWEEDGDKCTVKYAMECNQEASSSDAICECGEAGTTVNATSAPTGCDEAAWPDKDHDLVCGECKVLVNRFNSFYGSCDGYCSSIGRVCTGAWEEDGDKCTVKYGMECNHTLSSSDAICECGEAGPTPPPTPPTPAPTAAPTPAPLNLTFYVDMSNIIADSCPNTCPTGVGENPPAQEDCTNPETAGACRYYIPQTRGGDRRLGDDGRRLAGRRRDGRRRDGRRR